MAFSDIHYYY